MTQAERIEYFDGRGLRQIFDAFVVSREEMEVIKQMAISVSEMKRPNSRLIEFAQNWKRECDINGIVDICYADKRQNDLRLTPQFNTERRIFDGRRRRSGFAPSAASSATTDTRRCTSRCI